MYAPRAADNLTDTGYSNDNIQGSMREAAKPSTKYCIMA
ncbi:hypothetical protein APHCRT_1378 [Anaplasma phagocytophilum str. CRT53-1]|uniref:Uncharacterized protein n=1 Tax=Anaplasma phagocytophilum str. CRT53-1 TaxID=1359157 RepID=A0A0F3PP97_ANAPH|nr:hypothetical protein APHCRT_1378 [Anaplasma phagocytophilum str. CRT53-1]